MKYKDIYQKLESKINTTNQNIIDIINLKRAEIEKCLTNYASERDYVISFGESLGSKATVDTVKDKFILQIKEILEIKSDIDLGQSQNGKTSIILNNGKFKLDIVQRTGEKEASISYLLEDKFDNSSIKTIVLPNESLLLSYSNGVKRKLQMILDLDSQYCQRIGNDKFAQIEQKVDFYLSTLFDVIHNGAKVKKNDILTLANLNTNLENVQGLETFIEQQFKLKTIAESKPRNTKKLTS